MNIPNPTPAQIEAFHQAVKALPTPDNTDLSHWCCVRCDTAAAKWAKDMLPSGVRPQIICPVHGQNYGYPVKRFRASSITNL